MFLSWFEMIAGYMANLKVKFVCSTFGNEFNQSEKTSLFTIITSITSLKYKFVMHLLKEDGRNRSVSVYHEIIKFLISYFLKHLRTP